MKAEDTYSLLRSLTYPIVAVTSAWGDKLNGMISNSAIRASLVPTAPRVAVFVLKTNLSHDMIFQSGAFALHLLHSDNWDLIWELGFHSGRERDKLSGFSYKIGGTGCPLLDDVYARLDCRIVNVMDGGASTCFMGEAIDAERGTGDQFMTSDYFRNNMPDDWREAYEAKLVTAQEWAAQHSAGIRPVTWPGLELEP